MIRSKQQHFYCVESKELSFGQVTAKEYYEAFRENETEYRIVNTETGKEFRAVRDELLSCGYLC